MNKNEIRDYIERAPKRFHFNGTQMVNNTRARFVWLATLLIGTLNERINRRAGFVDAWMPWKNPVHSACRRHHRNELRKKGLKYYGHR